MKFVFVNRFFYPDHSATSQMLGDLAFFLAGAGEEVHVITSRQRYDDPRASLPALEKAAGVVIHRIWTSRHGRAHLAGRALDYLTFYAGTLVALARIVSPGDIVVAKTDPPLLSVVAAPMARLKSARLVNWLQDLFPEVAIVSGVRAVSGAAGRALVAVRDRSLRAATANVAIGERMAARLVARGVPREKVAVIGNWADGVLIRPVASGNNPLRSAWGLDGCFVVGYSGNMGRVHEFETILGAARMLGDLPRVKFLFIGGGNYRDWLEAQVAKRGLASFQFRPYQVRETLSESLSAPDVHLVSLRPEMEGLVVPSKIYGIAAAGRPAIFIGAPDGEVAAMLRRHNCGVVIAPGDANGLAAAIRSLSERPALAHEMGDNGRAAFEAHWDRAGSCRAWMQLLEALGKG